MYLITDTDRLETRGVFRGFLKKKPEFNAYNTTLFLVKYMGCKGGRLLIIRSAIHAWQGYIPTRHIQKNLLCVRQIHYFVIFTLLTALQAEKYFVLPTVLNDRIRT